MNKLTVIVSFILPTLLLVGACSPEPEKEPAIKRSFENTVGTIFTPSIKNTLKAPKVNIISVPEYDNIDAIWGATGRDDSGNVYFATSSHGGEYGSSYLYQYNPLTKTTTLQSDTVSQLKANKIYRYGMRQNKLHSKFYQADDGYIYFSSFDEGGEAEGINPTWGGHLWRKLPNSVNWEHVLATDEALVAVNTNGKYIYALGYWNHVLYQYNTESETTKSVVVGATGTHTSRNFIVDELGHAYVPSVNKNDFNIVEAVLVEYDIHLNEVARYPLPSYQSKDINKHHGIVAYTSVKNGDIYFTSAEGGLYKIKPFDNTQNKVQYQGMMHPDGEAYIASLFSIDGKGILAGVGRQNINNKKGKFEWIVYQTSLNLGYSVELPLENIKSPLLYGSLTRDNAGGLYLGGWHNINGGFKPLLVKLSFH